MNYDDFTIEDLEANMRRLETDINNPDLPQYLRNLKLKELEGFSKALNERRCGFDSDSTTYGRPQVQKTGGIFKPRPQGMNSDAELAEAKARVKFGSHSSLNIFDALRTMGYSEDDIKIYCKENNMKYDSSQAVKNPVKRNNPVQQQPLRRLWD